MAILNVPKVLREKLGDEGVEALITFLNEASHHERNNLLGILEDRFERRVADEGARLEVLLAETEKRLDHRIISEMARMGERMAGMRADLIRWNIFGMGQLGPLIAMLFAFFR